MESRVGFGLRFLASLIDLVIVIGIALLAGGAVASLVPDVVARKLAEATADPRAASAAGMISKWITISVAIGLISPLYSLTEALFGWTLGKLVLGIRIVTDAGTVAPKGRLVTRYLVKGSASLLGLLGMFTGMRALDIVSGVVGLAILIGFLLVLGKSRQGLHDKLAGTAVLRKSDIAVGASMPGAVAGV
jgi:uncharacterized RDD family membrane protein YckC